MTVMTELFTPQTVMGLKAPEIKAYESAAP